MTGSHKQQLTINISVAKYSKPDVTAPVNNTDLCQAGHSTNNRWKYVMAGKAFHP